MSRRGTAGLYVLQRLPEASYHACNCASLT